MCSKLEFATIPYMQKTASPGEYDIIRFSLMQDVLYMHQMHPGIPLTEDGFANSMAKVLQISKEQVQTMLDAVVLHKAFVSENADQALLQKERFVQKARYYNVPRLTLYCSGSLYSVDAYNILQRLGGHDKVSIDKQRELMLQCVVKNATVDEPPCGRY